MAILDFERAEAAETGRPGYDPRDLLKLYLDGYLHQLRSSRRLEAECRCNVELMCLLRRLYPDHKSIGSSAGCTAMRWRQPERFPVRVGGFEASGSPSNGTKFRVVDSADSVRERQAVEKHLYSMEKTDEEREPPSIHLPCRRLWKAEAASWTSLQIHPGKAIHACRTDQSARL
jgi:hypothetical protein